MDIVKILDNAEVVVNSAAAAACMTAGITGIALLLGNDVANIGKKFYSKLQLKYHKEKSLINKEGYNKQ